MSLSVHDGLQALTMALKWLTEAFQHDDVQSNVDRLLQLTVIVLGALDDFQGVVDVVRGVCECVAFYHSQGAAGE